MEHSNVLKYQKGFSDELLTFISFIDEIIPTEKTQMIISKYSKLNITKLLTRFHKIMQPLKSQITSRDATIFQQPLFIIPEFNLSFFWENLPDTNKSRVWETLSRLLIYCNIVLDNSPKETPVAQQTNQQQNNPFFGVKGGGTLSVSNIKNSVEQSQMEENPLMKMLTSNLNIDKSKLKNIDDATISKMTAEVKNMITPHVDGEVSDLIDNMISNIGDELKEVDLSSGEIFPKILNIAEKMSHKLASDAENNKFSHEKLLRSSKAIMNKIGLPEGTDLNKLASNPTALLSMVSQMAAGMNPSNMTGNNTPQAAAMIDMMSSLFKM
jgi:hypothetical protein